MGPLAERKYSYRYVLYLYCICSSVSHFWIVSGLQLSTVQTIGELMVYYCPRFKPGQGIWSFDLRSLNLRSFNLFDLSIFSILSIFKKDPPWPNRSRWSFVKIDGIKSLTVDLWKDWRDWCDDGSSFSKIDKSKSISTRAIQSFGIKRGENSQQLMKNTFFWANPSFLESDSICSIFFKDRREQFDHGWS